MRIHHLNCISTCPLGGRLMDGRTRSLVRRGHLSSHCLLVEGRDGLTLVDTGLGTRDVADPKGRLSAFFLKLVSPEFREELTAIRQVERLGFSARDVRNIVLTHLDFDHAGGLDDFPGARVHMMQRERDYALRQRTWMDRQRYRPQQWGTRPNWQVYQHGGDKWFGFSCVRELEGVRDDICLVPLPGHTHGHAAVAVRRNDEWLLLAGDAYFHHREMDAESPGCTPGLKLYQAMLDMDRGARLRNQQRLRELRAEQRNVQVFCSHDAVEFERLAGRSLLRPAEALRLAGGQPSGAT